MNESKLKHIIVIENLGLTFLKIITLAGIFALFVALPFGAYYLFKGMTTSLLDNFAEKWSYGFTVTYTPILIIWLLVKGYWKAYNNVDNSELQEKISIIKSKKKYKKNKEESEGDLSVVTDDDGRLSMGGLS